VTSALAPCSIKYFTIFSYSYLHAAITAVSSTFTFSLISAPFSIKYLTIVSWPFRHASIKGALNFVFSLTLTLFSIKNLTIAHND